MKTKTLASYLLPLSALLFTTLSHAGPADYVYTPNVEYGEREIDFKFGTAKLQDGSRINATSLGFGWGVTPRWFTEVYAKWHKEPFEKSGFDAWEWENKFQLTETGQWPVDVGVILEIERPKDRREGYELRWGPLFEMDVTSDVQANLNILWEKHVRAEEKNPAELGYQWQLKYRSRPEFEFGLQGFGEVGPWRHWNAGAEQSHIMGPAVFGKLKVGNGQAIRYNAAILLKTSGSAPKNTFRLQTEYEF